MQVYMYRWSHILHFFVVNYTEPFICHKYLIRDFLSSIWGHFSIELHLTTGEDIGKYC